MALATPLSSTPANDRDPVKDEESSNILSYLSAGIPGDLEGNGLEEKIILFMGSNVPQVIMNQYRDWFCSRGVSI